MKDNRKVIQVLTILTILFTIMGGSLAYWTWQSDNSTKITFSVGSNFSCSVDGGGNINQTSATEYIAPASCTNEDYAIKRKVVVTPTINKDDLTISMDLWLDIDNLGTGLSDSYYFKYVLSTSESSCEGSNIVNSGTFHGKTTGDTVVLLDRKEFTGTSATSQTYYLYIWLDAAETSSSTMNQSFSFSLNGSCTDNPGNIPNAPVLDAAMIPVTIADNGDVTTVSETDPAWYDYSDKQWANVVLVNENATSGVEDSQSREYYLNNLSNNVPVAEEDILAYYVWIPRYKYRIPSRVDKITMCGDLENPTIEEYPTCYGGPFSMSDEDKAKFQEYLSEKYNSGVGTLISGLEESLSTGIIRFYDGNVNTTYEYGLISEVSYYNSLEDGVHNTDAGGYFTKDGDITLKGGTFVSDRIYKHEQSTTPVSIDIAFESSSDTMVYGDAIETYYSHPGFWFDDNEDGNVDSGETLSGIWVGKFEMPLITDTTSSIEGVNYQKAIDRILPDYQTEEASTYANYLAGGPSFPNLINSFNLNNSFTKSHIIDDIKWGAIAYLTHSKYGINTTVENNNTMMTGGGTYGDLSSYPQSTTGNITGIFDMSGGNYEYVDSVCYYEGCYGSASFETNGWYGEEIMTSLAGEDQTGDYASAREGLFGGYYIFSEGPHEWYGTYRSVLINGFAN